MTPKIFVISCFVSLSACGEKTAQEYFCETSPEQAAAQAYRQQIVILTKDSFCLQGNADLLQCAKPNQAQVSPWQTQDTQSQRREIIKVKMSKDVVLLDLQKETRTAPIAQTPAETTTTNARYEFQKKDKTLIVTSQENEMPVVFTCKPWVKRAWWQIY